MMSMQVKHCKQFPEKESFVPRPKDYILDFTLAELFARVILS